MTVGQRSLCACPQSLAHGVEALTLDCPEASCTEPAEGRMIRSQENGRFGNVVGRSGAERVALLRTLPQQPLQRYQLCLPQAQTPCRRCLSESRQVICCSHERYARRAAWRRTE